MAEDESSRLEIEIELISAMYPEQVAWISGNRELKFSQDGALMHLRLPDAYPDAGLPDIIAAIDAKKNDIRSEAKQEVHDLGLSPGEEALDAIIQAFQQLLADRQEAVETAPRPNVPSRTANNSSKTVIIWLHHLLATGKRKLALAPQPSVKGITKPGYPGVMIFTGPSAAVDEHVNELKSHNWQAFQVRYEEPRLWQFGHETGVAEVESMSEVVALLDGTGHSGDAAKIASVQKTDFLKAVGIK